MLLTEFDEKKFAKSMWEEGHESGYLECRDSILKIMDETSNGNETVEKLVALGCDATLAQKYWKKINWKRLCCARFHHLDIYKERNLS